MKAMDLPAKRASGPAEHGNYIANLSRGFIISIAMYHWNCRTLDLQQIALSPTGRD